MASNGTPRTTSAICNTTFLMPESPRVPRAGSAAAARDSSRLGIRAGSEPEPCHPGGMATPGREDAPPFPSVREDGMRASRSRRLSGTLPAPGSHPCARFVKRVMDRGCSVGGAGALPSGSPTYGEPHGAHGGADDDGGHGTAGQLQAWWTLAGSGSLAGQSISAENAGIGLRRLTGTASQV